MFTMEDPVGGEPGLTIMIVDHPALGRLLKIAFEQVWQSGTHFT